MAHLCPDCQGTGAKKVHADGSYTRCWTCNGNGLDPAAYFRWGSPTGRLASPEPNIQNIPIRTPEGRAIRNAFTGDE